MRELTLVLNVKAHTLLKNLFDARLTSVVKNLSSLLIFGAVAMGVFALARVSTNYLIDTAHIGQFLYHRFLSMLFYVFFVTVNLGNMIVCYATMFKSEEVKFLMALPISHEKIFLLKFVDNFFFSSTTLTLLGVAWLLGYGSCYAMPWTFYFSAIFFVFLPFMLLAGLLAVLILMALIRVAVRVGIRILLSGLAVIYLLAIYLYFRVTNPVQLVEEVMKYYPYVNQDFSFLDPPVAAFLPNHWVSEYLFWSVQGNGARAFPWFAILLGVLAALAIIAAILARRYYYVSWLAATDVQSFQSSPRTAPRIRLFRLTERGPLDRQLDVLLKRDLWMFVREPSQWLHFLLIVVLLLAFLFSLGSLELKLTQPLLQTTSFLVVFLFIGFLVASILLRFVFPAVSLEGEAFWAVRSAPVSMAKLYLYKLVGSLALILTMSVGLAAVGTRLLRPDPILAGFAMGCMAFIGLGLTGLNLGAGSYFASYRERNPIRVASSQGASLTFLGSMTYLSFTAMILIVPLKKYFENLIVRGYVTTQWVILPIVLIGLFSTLLFIVSTIIGLKAIKRDL